MKYRFVEREEGKLFSLGKLECPGVPGVPGEEAGLPSARCLAGVAASWVTTLLVGEGVDRDTGLMLFLDDVPEEGAAYNDPLARVRFPSINYGSFGQSRSKRHILGYTHI